MEHRIVTTDEVTYAAKQLRTVIKGKLGITTNIHVCGIPRGGIPVSYLLWNPPQFNLTEDPECADVFVDDIVDSGKTRERWQEVMPTKPFFDLASQLPQQRKPNQWLVFPWEQGEQDTSGDDIVLRLLQYIGEDPGREGLRGTPARFLKAWRHWCQGYNQRPEEFTAMFKDGSEDYDNMIVVKDLPFFSHCEHHLAPFFGTATIAYIPRERVLGISKLGRILDVYARRLQIQERLTTQVADAVASVTSPVGVGVLIKARHLCMESRGLSKQGHETITSALRGDFMQDSKVREEFLSIAK